MTMLALSGVEARAQEMDRLLPDNIPGYGTPFGVVSETRDDRQPATGHAMGGSFAPPGNDGIRWL